MPGNGTDPTAGRRDVTDGFTVAAANRLLPYLRTTLAEVRAHVLAMQQLQTEIERLQAVGCRPSGEPILAADSRACSQSLDAHRTAGEQLLRDIAARGCLVKDIDSGLCDFPATLRGEPVLLCWRADEPSVTHYHGYQDGFAGRRPIPPGAP